MHNMTDEQYLTVYEAAERARVHPSTIRRAIKARQIEYAQSAPKAPIKITPAALRAWMKQQTKPALSVGKYGSRALRRNAKADTVAA